MITQADIDHFIELETMRCQSDTTAPHQQLAPIKSSSPKLERNPHTLSHGCFALSPIERRGLEVRAGEPIDPDFRSYGGGPNGKELDR